MASAQAFMTYWMLRLLVKPQIARRWGSQSLDEQRRGYERTAQRWGKLVPGAQVEPITIGLMDAERVVPLSAKPDVINACHQNGVRRSKSVYKSSFRRWT